VLSRADQRSAPTNADEIGRGFKIAMNTHNHIKIQASPKKVYEAAQRIVEWPRLLAHYRWVTVFSESKTSRQVEMAASRNGFPCKWQSEQILYPKQKKIYYRHTKSFWTKGMEVWWILKPLKGGATQVLLTHEMPPRSHFISRWFYSYVIGHLFVENIADKTLAGLKRHLEAS
jgi:ribosome-associated toxin RatA of RatAB toxin-antitoxin module